VKSKPKKNQLTRLRAFARHFADLPAGDHVDGIDDATLTKLRDEARFALTGQKSPALEQHHQVAADVKRLNKLDRKGVDRFLAGGA
jgi:hypothetical protein